MIREHGHSFFSSNHQERALGDFSWIGFFPQDPRPTPCMTKEKFLILLKQLPSTVDFIDLQGNNLGGNDIGFVKDVFSLLRSKEKLTRIDLSYNNLGHLQLTDLCELFEGLISVEEINLNNNDFGRFSFPEFQRLIAAFKNEQSNIYFKNNISHHYSYKEQLQLLKSAANAHFYVDNFLSISPAI